MNKRIQARLLRDQGLSYEKIGIQLRPDKPYSRQYIYQLLNTERDMGSRSGKTVDFLYSLRIDNPVFVTGYKRTELYQISNALNKKIVVRQITRKGQEGLWVCRIK